MKKIMISTGELSGDKLGSYLVRELKSLNSKIKFIGIGGENMKAEGVEILYNIVPIASMGTSIKPLRKLFDFIKLRLRFNRFLKSHKPDILICITSSLTNKPLAKLAKQLGIKTVNFFPPEAWAWGDKEERAKKNLVLFDHVIIPFELDKAAYYSAADTLNIPHDKISFFGHPFLDTIIPRGKEEIYKSFELEKSENLKDKFNPIVSLLPGSRFHEIENFLPFLLDVGEALRRKYPQIQLVVSIAAKDFEQFIQSKIKEYPYIKIVVGNSIDLISISDCVVATSGSVTLEAVVLNTPITIIYKVPAFVEFILRPIIKVKYASLPNLLLNKPVIKEFIQKKMTVGNVVKAVSEYIEKNSTRDALLIDYQEIRKKMGSKGAINKSAKNIVNSLNSITA